MEGNQLKRSLYLSACIVTALLLLSLIGEFSFGSFRFKRINILADVRQDDAKPLSKPDSTKKASSRRAVKKDPCKPGITCVEDFSDEGNALSYFFKSLKETRRRAVKVAFFGDSFIEGDILSSSFRDTLQQLYGGR